MQDNKFRDTVILVDADYVDGVAFDLTVNFERMLMRRISKADLAHWLVCVSLDGGLQAGENEVQVAMIYRKATMQNFQPGDLLADVDGKAFRDPQLGEFEMKAFRDEQLTGEDFLCEVLRALLSADEVKRIVLVPDMGRSGAELKHLLAQQRGKDVTLLSMQPEAGRGFQSEILGYSLMQALGIRSNELMK